MSSCEKTCRNMNDLLDGRAKERVKRAVELHLDQCSDCAAHYEQLQLQCQWLAQDEALELPAGLHEAIMHKIAQSAPCPTHKRFYWMRTVAALCCCAIVAFAAVKLFPTFLMGQSAMPTAESAADLSTQATAGEGDYDMQQNMIMQAQAPEETFESYGVTHSATASGQADGSKYMTSSDDSLRFDEEQQTTQQIENYLAQAGLVLVIVGDGVVTMEQLMGDLPEQTLAADAALLSAADAAQLEAQFAQQWPDLTLYRYESELDVETTGVVVLLES